MVEFNSSFINSQSSFNCKIGRYLANKSKACIHKCKVARELVKRSELKNVMQRNFHRVLCFLKKFVDCVEQLGLLF